MPLPIRDRRDSGIFLGRESSSLCTCSRVGCPRDAADAFVRRGAGPGGPALVEDPARGSAREEWNGKSSHSSPVPVDGHTIPVTGCGVVGTSPETKE